MSHSISIERRTDGSFTPILVGGKVLPGEPVRYKAFGIDNQAINLPEFVVMAEDGTVVFRRSVPATFGGDAWVDTVAPTEENWYVLSVSAQTYPFLPMTHTVQTSFGVSSTASPPPSPPPETGFLPNLKGLIWAGVALVGAIAVSNMMRKR